MQNTIIKQETQAKNFANDRHDDLKCEYKELEN